MIKVALVSYFNTRPFIDGLNHWFGEDEIKLIEVPPSLCAASLRNKECDIALLPVGSLVDFEGIHLLKDHCIGADGKVDSVFLFSKVPIQEATGLVLDAHSRTSNGLAAILLKYYWEKEVSFIYPQGERFAQIDGNNCGVAIGDKAYAVKDEYPFVYDLAEVWKRFCGLPFAFAVWAYRPEALDIAMRERLRAALEWGRVNRKKSASKWGKSYGYSDAEAEKYLVDSISFEFDSAKHEAMKQYFQLLQTIEGLHSAE